MPVYKYFDIAVNNGRLVLYCTDFAVLDALVHELEGAVPHSVSPNVTAERGNIYTLFKFSAREYKAFTYLVRRLGEMGWEPFAASRLFAADNMPSERDRFVAFRFSAGAL